MHCRINLIALNSQRPSTPRRYSIGYSTILCPIRVCYTVSTRLSRLNRVKLTNLWIRPTTYRPVYVIVLAYTSSFTDIAVQPTKFEFICSSLGTRSPMTQYIRTYAYGCVHCRWTYLNAHIYSRALKAAKVVFQSSPRTRDMRRFLRRIAHSSCRRFPPKRLARVAQPKSQTHWLEFLSEIA
jgi:hypothetical protein